MMRGLANVGDVLAGKYRVEKILGIGGMGMVVAATHLELDQQVALKFMLPAAMQSPEACARFLREARAAGKLTSEHVCRVSDVGRFESGAPYIVMEYLEGYDLGTMLKRRGPLRIAPAVDYILQACEGLAEAHSQGIVHRDLKPDNLYLAARADGGHTIKVLDFGISKATVTGIATQTGDILGSPAYMSPEQMKSTKDVDPRADLWSLGVVMYQLLTGRLPFSGDSLPTLCLSVLNEDPVPPNEVRQDIPQGLADVILRCLAKDPEDRFFDVGELAAALGPYATPNGFASVTRVQSALKGRQAPPDPSQTIPHGFAAQGSVLAPGGVPQGVVPPTLQATGSELHGPGNSDLFAPRLPGAPRPAVANGEEPVGITTVSAGSGESIEMTTARPRQPRFPIGLVGGLCAAIGLVLVLILMVLRSGHDAAAPEATPPPGAVAQPQVEEPKPQEPKVTPIEEPQQEPVVVQPVEPPPGSGSAGAGAPGAPDRSGSGAGASGTPDTSDGSGTVAPDKSGSGAAGKPAVGVRPKPPIRGKRPPKGRKDGKDGSKGQDEDVTVVDDSPPPLPPPPPPGQGSSDEDKWNRMQHDQPKKDKAP